MTDDEMFDGKIEGYATNVVWFALWAIVFYAATNSSWLNGGSSASSPDTHQPPPSWEYVDTPDVVRGGSYHIALLTSSNVIQLDPPYSGGTSLEIAVRKSANKDLNVLLTLKPGQLVCQVGGCSTLIRFDDGKPVRYPLAEPADYSSDTLFILRSADFVMRLKAAKKVNIEVNVFEGGSPQFRFETAGLVWD